MSNKDELCRVSMELNDYIRLGEDFYDALGSTESSTKTSKKYNSPDYIWEAIGPDAIQYPDSIKNMPDRLDRSIAKADYDNDLALKISDALQAKDYMLVGTIIGEMANAYLAQ